MIHQNLCELVIVLSRYRVYKHYLTESQNRRDGKRVKEGNRDTDPGELDRIEFWYLRSYNLRLKDLSDKQIMTCNVEAR